MQENKTQTNRSFQPDLISTCADRVYEAASGALSKTRLEVLLMLAIAGEADVTHIARELELDRSVVSHALAVLRKQGLVEAQPVGRTRRYRPTRSVQYQNGGGGFTLQIDDGDGLSLTVDYGRHGVAERTAG
ncbi:MAG: metalloregulator ArsR/SmtB family transcription factor [Planctomycetota bacterium]